MNPASASKPAASPRPPRRITNRYRIAAVLSSAGRIFVEGAGDFASALVEDGTLRLQGPCSLLEPARLVTLVVASRGVPLFGYARVLTVTQTALVVSLPAALLQVRERGDFPVDERLECATSMSASQLCELFHQEQVAVPPQLPSSRTFVLHQDGELVGAVTGLRVFSRTWVTQHLLMKTGLSGAARNAQRLLGQSLEFGQTLPNIEFLRSVLRVPRGGGDRVPGRLSDRLFREGLGYRVRYEAMRLGFNRPLAPTPLPVREARPDDESAFLTLVTRTEDPLKLLSDDLVPGQVTAGRSLFAVDDRRGETLGWALISPGIRGSFRLFLLDPSGPLASQARLSLAVPGLECHAAPSDVADLSAHGYVSEGTHYEFGAHRSMAREFIRKMGAILAHVRKHPSEACLASQYY